MADPFSGLAGLMIKTPSGSGTDICTGEILSISPLKVRAGETELDAADVTLCAHVTLPDGPGGKLLLVSLDENQSYYAIGRC